MIQHPIESGKPYAVIALNYILPKFLPQIWESAKLRICADGGANRVLKHFKTIGQTNYKFPQYIIGDLDSIQNDTRDFLTSKGTEFVKIYNQDYNDAEKTLLFLKDIKNKYPLVILGGLGGRFDQSAQSLSVALKYSNTFDLFFLDDHNFMTWILPKHSKILTPRKMTTDICGLLPVAGPVRHIKTSGLKWDVDYSLKLGTFISSSNEITKDCVQVKTSDPILWMNETKLSGIIPVK